MKLELLAAFFYLVNSSAANNKQPVTPALSPKPGATIYSSNEAKTTPYIS